MNENCYSMSKVKSILHSLSFILYFYLLKNFMKLLLITTALLTSLSVSAQKQKQMNRIPTEDEMGAYVMVYHKDQDHSLHMALSYDSYHWTALNNDEAVISGDSIAVQHGIRDPHIFRGPDGGFYLAMTDLHLFSQKNNENNNRFSKLSAYRDTQWERDASYGWGNNRGLVMMKSFDLIHWTRTNLDFSSLTCPTGVTDHHGNPIPWSEVGCVWAPETVYDYEKGHLLVHFTTRMKSGTEMIYYIYMNDDFTQMLSQKQDCIFRICNRMSRHNRGILYKPYRDNIKVERILFLHQNHAPLPAPHE